MTEEQWHGKIFSAFYSLYAAKRDFAQAQDTGTIEELKAASVQHAEASKRLLKAVLDFTSSFDFED